MRSGSLITLSSLISSIIAGYSSYPNVQVQKSEYNVLCGSDTYSIDELQQATYRGCDSLMIRNKCGEAGKCKFIQKLVGPKEYTGVEFKNHQKKVYIWGLPKRKGSDYVSGVLFDSDPVSRQCKTLAANYRYKDVEKSFICDKLELNPLVNLWRSPSPPRNRQGGHSPPRPRKENHSPPRPRKESHTPAPDGQESSNEVIH